MALATTVFGHAVSLLFNNAYTSVAPLNARSLRWRICAKMSETHYFNPDNVRVLANLVVNIVQGTAWNFGSASFTKHVVIDINSASWLLAELIVTLASGN